MRCVLFFFITNRIGLVGKVERDIYCRGQISKHTCFIAKMVVKSAVKVNSRDEFFLSVMLQA